MGSWDLEGERSNFVLKNRIYGIFKYLAEKNLEDFFIGLWTNANSEHEMKKQAPKIADSDLSQPELLSNRAEIFTN